MKASKALLPLAPILYTPERFTNSRCCHSLLTLALPYFFRLRALFLATEDFLFTVACFSSTFGAFFT